jgi:membrane protease YdiL (CAAX protease family)
VKLWNWTGTGKLTRDLFHIFQPASTSSTLLAAVIIPLIEERYGWQTPLRDYLLRFPPAAAWSAQRLDLNSQVLFSLTSLLAYCGVPALIAYVIALPEQNSMGLRTRNLREFVPICVVTLLAVAPVVAALCTAGSVATYYPLYRAEGARDWVIYECLYFIQISAVEFFFRGFLLFRLEGKFGRTAVLISVIPYAFIHMHKPTLELLGSIPVGILLGALAWSARSIWPGVFLHYATALIADILCSRT